MSAVLASRRFQKEYPQFLDKYDGLEPLFREFIGFRLGDRYPDGTRLGISSFGKNDGPVPGSGKFRRWHAIHGKAILLYQLYANKTRLIMLDEHKYLDHHNWGSVKQYAEGLKQDDYYQFDIDHPRPTTTTHDRPSDPLPQLAPPPPIVQPQSNGHTALWDDRSVQYARERQLLWEPRPASPLVVITLDKDLLAAAGDAVVIDAATKRIFHLTRNELEAHFQPAAQATTDLGEALAIALQPIQEPEPIPEAIAQPPVVPFEPEPELTGEPEDLPAEQRQAADKILKASSRLSRVLVTMAFVQQQQDPKKINTAAIRQYLEPQDHRSLSAMLAAAQAKGYVKKLTGKGPTGYYYALTKSGEAESRRLNKAGLVSLQQPQFQAAA